jgi:hypothetical protein
LDVKGGKVILTWNPDINHSTGLAAGGSKFVRIHFDSFGMGYLLTGIMDESWAMKWGSVFDKAASIGINVIPVFGARYDWNNKDDLF